jgi:NADH:ubiquinone oxidoreductase subunit B-like Fe-S oxidoreductase
MFSTRGDVMLCGGEVHRLALADGRRTHIVVYEEQPSPKYCQTQGEC